MKTMETITELKDKFTDAAADLGAGAMSVAQNLQSHAKDAWGTVQDQTSNAMHESVEFARKHPATTALVACGVGLLAGLLLKGRAPASFKDRYIMKPLHQSRGLLLGALIACGTLFKRTFTYAEHATKSVGDNGKGVVKTVKRAIRKAAR